MRIARILFAQLPEHSGVTSPLAAELSDEAALALYRWQLRVQARVFAAKKNPAYSYTDYVYFTPRVSRLIARFKFAPDLSALTFRFREQGDGDLGARLDRACREVLAHHDMTFIWGADVPCLPEGIFDQAAALYPQSVVTLARGGGCAFLSLAVASYSSAVFEKVRWHVPAAGADQIRALQAAQIKVVVRGRATRVRQIKDFTRMLRELEAAGRTTDLEDLTATLSTLPP